MEQPPEAGIVMCMVGTTYIRAWRLHRGQTLEQLSERIGVTHGALSRIERGLRPYNQIQLEAAASALDCRPADLLARDPTDPEEIWSLWPTLSMSERQRAIAVIKALRAQDRGGEAVAEGVQPLRPKRRAHSTRPPTKRAGAK
jgi:transcriptional regulator with XRE-family HTH domain